MRLYLSLKITERESEDGPSRPQLTPTLLGASRGSQLLIAILDLS